MVRDTAGGARLRVRVAPRSSAPGLDGVVEDGAGGHALRLRLQSPPVEGRANAEAVRRVADALAVPARDVALVAGVGARLKVLEVSGLSASEVLRRLAAEPGPDG